MDSNPEPTEPAHCETLVVEMHCATNSKMTYKQFFCVLMVILGLLISVHGWTITYYTSVAAGSNGNNGLTELTPFQTIQFGLDALQAGDTLMVLAGTYFEKIEFNNSGTGGNAMVLMSKPGDPVYIDGTGAATTPEALISIFDQSHIQIIGLILQHNIHLDAQGIVVEGDCQDIGIYRNEVHHINYTSMPVGLPTAAENAQAIIVYGSDGTKPISDLIIAENNIHDCILGFSEGIAVNGNVDGFIIRDNIVKDLTNIGIDAIGFEGTAPTNDQARNGHILNNEVLNCKSPYATAAGIYVDGGADIIIARNYVENCQWGIEVGCENIGESTSRIEVHNNVLIENDDAGIVMGGYDFPSGSGKVINSSFRNNTLIANDDELGGVGGVTGSINISYVENAELKNNLVYGSSQSGLVLYIEGGSINLDVDYNLYDTPAGVSIVFDYSSTTYSSLSAYGAGSNQDLNSVEANPGVVSSSGNIDIHLIQNSAAINGGDPSTVLAQGEVDFFADARIELDTIDIGADEYNSALPVIFEQAFTARLRKQYVNLAWQTAMEINNDHFIVERSIDLRSWERVISVPAKGFGYTYTIEDRQPYLGDNYYRLVQVDLDGTRAYSAVQEIWVDAEIGTPYVFPNPASTTVDIGGISKASIQKWELIDPTGKLLQFGSGWRAEVDLARYGLLVGTYFIHVTTVEGSQVLPFLRR